jgi:anti-sigma factor RsiW
MEDTCTMTPRVGAYHDGELDETARTAVEDHLTACDTCRGELEALRRVSSLFAATPMARLDARELREVRTRAAELAEPLPLGFIGGLLAAAASIVIVCGAWWGEIPQAGGPGSHGGDTPIASRSLEPWEQMAVGPWRAHLEFREDATAVAARDEQLADWMLSGLGGGSVEGMH